MKIEKINDNQIRCTLNKEDLVDRELRISELAYGTEKAKNLFRDMMQQASYEFGFEAEDIPLMIEAIPVSNDCLVLVITKVEDPDELDTRFSKFSSNRDQDTEELDYDSGNEEESGSYADEIINCFDQLEEILDGNNGTGDRNFVPLSESLTNKISEEKSKKVKSKKDSFQKANLMKVYSFATLDDIIRLSGVVVYTYNGINCLYKNPSNVRYYLVTYKSEHTPQEYNKVCNIISEYGKIERTTYASASYFEEHYETIIKDNALQILAKL